MSHAPECSGRVYYCSLCPDLRAMTIGEHFAHTEAQHPETLTVLEAPTDAA